MGIITISMDDDVEKKFRKAASLHYGKKKGALGKAMTKAIEAWLASESDNVQKTYELLEKGFDSGGLLYKSREELHDR